jgi:hypothetical protein
VRGDHNKNGDNNEVLLIIIFQSVPQPAISKYTYCIITLFVAELRQQTLTNCYADIFIIMPPTVQHKAERQTTEQTNKRRE